MESRHRLIVGYGYSVGAQARLGSDPGGGGGVQRSTHVGAACEAAGIAGL